jgi:hypothetical protein
MFGAKEQTNGSDPARSEPEFPSSLRRVNKGPVIRQASTLPPARPLNEGERQLVSEVEGQIAEFVKQGGVTGGPSPLEEAIDNIDLAAPPPAALEMANLLASTFETYAAALDQVRAAIILEAARAAYEIDTTKIEMVASKDVVSNHHLDFMRRMRNHLIGVADMRRTVEAQRAAVALAAPPARQATNSESDDHVEQDVSPPPHPPNHHS